MNGNDSGAPQLSAREILAVLFRRKVPIILCAVAVSAAALTAASRTTSVYQATAKVLLRRTGATPLSVTWTPFYGLEEEMNTEVEIITTETVLQRAVDILLAGGVYIHEDVGDSQITRDPTIYDVAAGLSAEPVEMSNIILIQYRGADRGFVAEAANAVAEAYVEYRTEVRKGSEISEYFEDQLHSVEGRLLELQQTELALRKQGEVFDLEWQYRVAISRRSELQEELAGIRSKRIGEEQKLDLAEKRLAEEPGLLVPFSEFVRDKLGGQMLTEYWHLRKDRDEKAALFTDTNPQVAMLDERIASMEDRFREETARRLKEQRFLIEDLRAEEAAYTAAIEEISEELRQTPDVVANIQHLQKEIHYTYAHYDKILEKMLETMATEASDFRIAKAKVISPARTQMTKAGRMQTVYVAFSLLLGVTLGIGFGFLLENLDHSVKSAGDVEETLGVPLLGSVPESRQLPELTQRVDRTFGRNS